MHVDLKDFVVVPDIILNGSSKDDLLSKLTDASRALAQATEALSWAAPNARDYQVSGRFNEASEAHQERMKAVRHVRQQIEWLIEGIEDQGE
jgi:hypothetical protein